MILTVIMISFNMKVKTFDIHVPFPITDENICRCLCGVRFEKSQVSKKDQGLVFVCIGIFKKTIPSGGLGCKEDMVAP